MKIALLEDEEISALIVMALLNKAGHDVDWFKSGAECIRCIYDKQYDLCLFDWMLPDMNGPEVMAHLKLKGTMPPVIFLTGRDAEEDIVQILRAGADDYMVKPPSNNILLSRINALIRRTATKHQMIESFGNLSVNYLQHRIELDNAEVILTDKETFLALCLFKNIGTLISRTYLAQTVWGHSTKTNSRTVDVHISRIREKLKLTTENGWRLYCVSRRGYRLEYQEQ
jgi:DNA-binding response OmpR family regulator